MTLLCVSRKALLRPACFLEFDVAVVSESHDQDDKWMWHIISGCDHLSAACCEYLSPAQDSVILVCTAHHVGGIGAMWLTKIETFVDRFTQPGLRQLGGSQDSGKWERQSRSL